MPNSAVVIPARYTSVRLPGKTLLNETGKYLVQHVYEQATLASLADAALVATDDQRVVQAVESFGGRAVMTSAEHRSGTDRVAEASRELDADIIVNVQGDEPEIEPQVIDQVIELLERHPSADMSTLASPIREVETVRDPNLVKVVLDASGYALYFSRAPIPASKSYPELPVTEGFNYLGHLGIYGFRREFLFTYAALPRSPLEEHEGLEQLRAIEHGHPIVVGITGYQAQGVDTAEDYRDFVERWRASHPA